MSSTEITNEQITAGATVLARYKNLRLNWRNAAIDVFDAMTAAAPASADNPSTAGAAPADWLFRSRVADLIHLLPVMFEFQEGDRATGAAALADVRKMLAAPAPHAQPEPAAQSDLYNAIMRLWSNKAPANFESAHWYKIGHRDARHAAAELVLSVEPAAQVPTTIPGILFDGHAVYAALEDSARPRTSTNNVSDVLDAVVRLMRKAGAAQVPTAAEVRDQALKFAEDVISNAFDGGDLDGATIQEMAEARGLIRPQTMAEPCGAVCGCMESGADFPAACYRKTYAAVLRTTSKEAAQAIELYTCIDKGGEYELLGEAYGAGTSKGSAVAVYRDTTTLGLFYRSVDDFGKRMKPLPCITSKAQASAHSESGGDDA